MVVLALTLGLAALLSSPDVPPVTIATWARLAPADFLATAATELNGTSETATYGPPYNNQTASAQRLLFSPATIVGVHPAGQRRAGLRDRPAGHARAHRPGPRRPARHLQGRPRPPSR